MNKINKIIRDEKNMLEIRKKLVLIPLSEFMKESEDFIEFKADMFIFRLYGPNSEEKLQTWGSYNKWQGIRGWVNYYIYEDCALIESSIPNTLSLPTIILRKSSLSASNEPTV